MKPSANTLANELNLGPKSTRMLAAVGIHSVAQLRKRGAIAAYLAVKRQDAGASLNLLYALVGALEGCHWREVMRTRKLQLLLALEDVSRAAHKH